MTVPEGDHSITPYFTVLDADQLVAFLIKVFNGTVVLEKRNSHGRIEHARVRIGDSILMLNESTDEYPVNVSQLHLFVDDVDISFSTAIREGAVAVMEPNIRPHGDRMAGIKDPCGNIWWIAHSH
jgi:PhnB protein